MNKEKDCIIHLCTAGVSYDSNGELENLRIPFACNAHTHGMDKYNHLDFQVVLPLSTNVIYGILARLCKRVQAGDRFQSGDYVSHIVEGGQIRLDEFEESGRKVLRAIIPDENGAFPESPMCSDAVRLQLLKADYLSGTPEFFSHWLGDVLWESFGMLRHEN